MVRMSCRRPRLLVENSPQSAHEGHFYALPLVCVPFGRSGKLPEHVSRGACRSWHRVLYLCADFSSFLKPFAIARRCWKRIAIALSSKFSYRLHHDPCYPFREDHAKVVISQSLSLPSKHLLRCYQYQHPYHPNHYPDPHRIRRYHSLPHGHTCPSH